jgi:hypothetical protein
MPPAESGRGSRCVRRRKFAARKRENAVRHRGLRLVTPLVARATGTWPHRTLMPPASSFITPRREQLISCRLKGSSISASVAPEGEAAHVPPQLTLRRPIARQPLPSPTRARKGADRGVRRDRSGLQQGATCGSRRRGAVAIVDVESASDAGALRKSRLAPPSSAGVRRHQARLRRVTCRVPGVGPQLTRGLMSKVFTDDTRRDILNRLTLRLALIVSLKFFQKPISSIHLLSSGTG